MANKKISELDSRASLSLSDLMAVGDPATGYLYKTTISDLKTLTGAGVISFNGRVGVIVPTEGDYNLTQLGDVIITSVTSGQFLRYNGSNFVNTGLSASDIPDLSATYQPLDGDLTTIAGLTGTGILKRTGSNTWSLLTDNTANWDTAYSDRYKWDGGSTGLVAATGRTSLGLVIGTDVQAWDADLDAIAALAGTSGFLKKTAANTWSLDTNTYLTTAAGAATYEPIITAGTTAQYWRGDKSWQTLNTDAVAELTNLYFTNARARAAISASTGISYNSTTGAISSTITQYTDALARAAVSLTTTGSSGAATYNSTTGVLNVPTYTLSGLGGQPLDADLTAIAGLLGTSGFLKKTAADTWALDTNTYLTGNQTITLSGDVSGSGATAITTTIGAGKVTNAMLAGSIAASKLVGTDIATVGTITSGIWNGSAIGDSYISSAATWNAKEPAIAAGTTAQYWRGDKTWQTLPSYSLPIASATVLGGIKVGSNLSINATTGVLDATFTYTLPTASTTVLGGVKVDGTTITINGSGVISGANTYSLPVATTSVLGGVKIGTGIAVDVNGVISVTGVQSQLNGTGFVKATGTTISYDSNTYYLASNPNGYISSYTETDTLATVTGRGASTNTAITINNALMVSGNVSNLLTVQNNAATNYTTAYIAQTVSGGNGNQNIGLLVDIQGAGATDRIANFRYYNSGSPLSVLSITRGSGVGVYTEIPTATFDVNGSGRIRDVLRLDNAITYQTGILNLTGGTVKWCKVGNLVIPQSGHTCVITFNGGAGYNADDGQNGTAEIFLRTSNGTPNGSGFYISGWLNVKGFTTGFITDAALVQNNATSYDVYVKLGVYSGNTYYKVEGSNVSFTASGSVYGDSAPAGSLLLQNSFRVVSNSIFQSNLDSYGIISSGGLFTFNNTWTTGTINKIRGYSANDDKSILFSYDNSPAGITIKDNNSIQLRIGTNSAFHIDSNRQIGIGVQNSNWSSTYFRALELGNANSRAFIYGRTDTAIEASIGANAYYSSTGWKYANTGGASTILFSDNEILFRIATSGSADAALSWIQPMTLSTSQLTVATAARVSGVLTYGGDTNFSQTYASEISFGSGFRELFRVNSYGLCTGGRFTLSGTGNSFVHTSQWAWSSTHNGGTGRARLIQLTGGEYSDIQFAIDTTTGGNIIISANFPSSYTLRLVIEKTAGTAIDTSYANTDRTTAASGYSRVQSIYSIPYGSQVYKLIAENDVIAYSDAKLKTNVKTIDNALNKVLSLRGVSYNRIDIEQDIERIGVIAQEVQKVLPQVVTNSGSTLGVSYGNMVGVLIEAIKEQQKQIDQLKNKN